MILKLDTGRIPQYYPNLMSLGTIAGTRMWGCAAAFAVADSRQGARSPVGCLAHTRPRSASRIGQSSHGALRALANHPTGWATIKFG